MTRKALLSLALALASFGCHAHETTDTCLMFAAHNIATGSGNLFVYETFSEQRLKIQEGELYLDLNMPNEVMSIISAVTAFQEQLSQGSLASGTPARRSATRCSNRAKISFSNPKYEDWANRTCGYCWRR